MFKGKSSESTTPLTNESHSGIRSSQSSIIKTLLTYNLMLFFFFLVSNISNGALLGMKSIALNSSYPSTEKCLTDKCSSQSLVRALQKATYSSLVTSSPFLIHNGLVLFYSSNSWVTSLTFFFFLSFGLSFSSSTSTPSSSFQVHLLLLSFQLVHLFYRLRFIFQERDEFRVFFDQFFQSFFFYEFTVVGFKEKGDLSSSG